jgi:chromosome partitioning protein
MRRIALINQKGGVGKTTSAVNLGAALARAGKRVALIDLDPQANLSLHVDRPVREGEPSIYSVLTGTSTLAQALQATSTPGLSLVPSSIDLSGAELELANAFGRELLLREAFERWESEARASSGAAPADYVLIDCPPSLGLLAVNGLVAAREVLIAVQTEFFALQGMSKLMDVLQVLRRRLNPALATCGILACLYDNRLKLAREVLAEVRRYFPGQVFARPIGKNVKLAEAPGYGKTIYEYAPGSPGAHDYEAVAREMIAQESAQTAAAAPSAPAAVPLPPTEVAPLQPKRSAPASTAPKRQSAQQQPAVAKQQVPSASKSEPAAAKPARSAQQQPPVAAKTLPAETQPASTAANVEPTAAKAVSSAAKSKPTVLKPEPPKSAPVAAAAVPTARKIPAAVNKSVPAAALETAPANGRKLRAAAPSARTNTVPPSAPAPAAEAPVPASPAQPESKASQAPAAPSPARRRSGPRVVGDLSLD